MRFNLEQLRAFTLSVEKGSFTAAGREMGKVQSAVSTAIANLELDLGLTLFDRSRREPTLTEHGKALLPQAKALLTQALLLEGHADAMMAGEEGRLSLALEESLIGPALDELLVNFEQRFPSLELELLMPARMDIIRMAQQGRIDIGLMISTLAKPDNFRITPMGEMQFVAVCAPTFPLAQQKILSFDDMMTYRQLVLTSREGVMKPDDQISHQVWRVESQFGLIALLKKVLGWAWVPKHMVEIDLDQGDLLELKVSAGGDRFHFPVDLVTSISYREGLAGQWLSQQLASLPFLNNS